MKPRMTDVVLPPTFEQTASFTPGPWQINTTGNIGNAIKAQSGKRTYEGDDGFRAVALFMDCCSSELAATQEENRLANARLIAAAPELLAALENLDFHAASFATNSAGPLQPELLRMSLGRARAAIAKAKAGA